MKFLRELWTRLRAKTPAFFVQIQKFLLAVSVVAGVGLAQIEQLPKWAWLEEALRMGVFAGLFGTFLAQLTKVQATEPPPIATPPNNEASNTNNPNNL